MRQRMRQLDHIATVHPGVVLISTAGAQCSIKSAPIRLLSAASRFLSSCVAGIVGSWRVEGHRHVQRMLLPSTR